MLRESPVPPADSSRRASAGTDSEPSFQQVAQRLMAARDFAAVYISAQAGRLRLAAINLLVLSIVGVVGLIAVATFAVVAVVLVCIGTAGGIGALFGGRVWVGDLVVGVVILGGTAAVGWFGFSRIQKMSRRRTTAGYLKTKIPN